MVQAPGYFDAHSFDCCYFKVVVSSFLTLFLFRATYAAFWLEPYVHCNTALFPGANVFL